MLRYSALRKVIFSTRTNVTSIELLVSHTTKNTAQTNNSNIIRRRNVHTSKHYSGKIPDYPFDLKGGTIISAVAISTGILLGSTVCAEVAQYLEETELFVRDDDDN
eukprot:CFRG8673